MEVSCRICADVPSSQDAGKETILHDSQTLRAVKPIDAAPSSRTANIWVLFHSLGISQAGRDHQGGNVASYDPRAGKSDSKAVINPPEVQSFELFKNPVVNIGCPKSVQGT